MPYLPENRQLNPAHVEKLLELLSRGEYYNMLGMNITELAVGLCAMEVEVKPQLLNSFGGIHGGAYASILDTVTYWACYGDIDENQGYATLDLYVNDLCSVNSGKIIATGRPIRAGRSILVSEARVTTPEGKLLATAVSKMFMAPDIQPISKMVANLEPGLVMPPKFINCDFTPHVCADHIIMPGD